MTDDLATQLLEYGRYHRIEQRPVGLDEIVPSHDLVRPVVVDMPVRRRDWQRGILVAATAAVAVLLLVGGVLWLTQIGTRDDVVDTTAVPSTTAPVPSTTLPSSSAQNPQTLVVGPGHWSVAATAGAGMTPEQLAGVAGDVRTWPGVIEVVELTDEGSWESVTGLADECPSGSEPPCGPGIVAMITEGRIAEAIERLESEHAMQAVAAEDVVVAFIRGYEAAALERSSPVPLEFDPGPLGVEVPLTGPFMSLSGEQCGRQCDILVELEIDGVVLRSGFELWEDEIGSGSDEGGIGIVEVAVAGDGPRHELRVLDASGGRGFGIGDLLLGDDGRGGAIAYYGFAEGTGLATYALAGLPVQAAVVVVERADGTTVWQQPLGGMALIADPTDIQAEQEIEFRVDGLVTVLDATGTEIMKIEASSDGPAVIDLRTGADYAEPGSADRPIQSTLPDVLVVEDPSIGGYFAAVAENAVVVHENPTIFRPLRGPAPEFDTSAFGSEFTVPLVETESVTEDDLRTWLPPENRYFEDIWESDPVVYMHLLLPGTGTGLRIFLYERDGQFCHTDLEVGGGGGRGCGPYGPSGEVFVYGPDTNLVPADTSVVAVTAADGTRIWYRPVGGYLLEELRTEGSGSIWQVLIEAYDRTGNLIGRWTREGP